MLCNKYKFGKIILQSILNYVKFTILKLWVGNGFNYWINLDQLSSSQKYRERDVTNIYKFVKDRIILVRHMLNY